MPRFRPADVMLSRMFFDAPRELGLLHSSLPAPSHGSGSQWLLHGLAAVTQLTWLSGWLLHRRAAGAATAVVGNPYALLRTAATMDARGCPGRASDGGVFLLPGGDLAARSVSAASCKGVAAQSIVQ